MQKIRCFVAMPFDKPDVDTLYDTVIAKLLKSKDVLPRRIDRIQHNEEITKKIITEIQCADFVIADLTYARPSVYYEAGFAERNIPVIYTTRSDHFKPKTDDIYGNLNIHFDLQVKNIIKWKDPNDKFFRHKLDGRIKYVIKPILIERRARDKEKREQAEYAKLSMIKKTSLCNSFLQKKFRKLKFKKRPVASLQDKRRSAYYALGEVRTAYLNKTAFFTVSTVLWRTNRNELQDISNWYIYHDSLQSICECTLKNYRRAPKNVLYTTIIVSPYKINFDVLIDSMFGWDIGIRNNIQYLHTDVNETTIKLNKKKYSVNTASLFIVIDRVKSKSNLSQMCEDTFKLVLNFF